MKDIVQILKKAGLSIAVLLLIGQFANAASFTAIASGNWSSTATWGGSTPGTTITVDQIVIPSGITVNLDNNTSFNGALASLDVQGTLTSSANTSLTVDLGTIFGGGVMAVHELLLNAGATLTFTGQVAVNVLTSATTSLAVAADVIVNETLNIATGTLNLQTGGNLDVGTNADIIISGGTLSIAGGGNVGLSGSYNVIYTSGSANGGLELTGTGLNDVTVNVSGGNSVSLTSHLTVSGTLTLMSGTLVLNGNDLTITGNVSASGSGFVSSTSGSNISINATGGIAGSLNFSGGSNSVNNLSIAVGEGNQAQIEGTLTVNGTLTLTSGSLDISSSALIISGDVSGSGSLNGSGSTNLTVTTTGGLSGMLNFATGGQMINAFTINVGSGNSVSLGSDLTVNGNLYIASGNMLDISGHTLTIGSSGDIGGNGLLVVNGSSGVIVNASGGISGSLGISGSSMGTFTVNVGNGNSLTIDNDVNVSGNLNLQSGSLVLNNNDLTISGDISSGGSGTITSSAGSDISISGNASPSGSLSFSSGGDIVNDLTINLTGGSSSVMIGSDLTVEGSLTFSDGSINIGSNLLSIGASGSISGSGSSSYVITGAGGSLGIDMSSGGGSINFPVGTSTNFSPANITLNSGGSGTVMVGVIADVFAQGTGGVDLSTTQPVVDATWNIASDISSGLDMDIELWWSAAMEVNSFTSSAAYIAHNVGGTWDATTTASATAQSGGMFSIQRSGITSLSPFAVFDQNTVTGINQLSNNDSEIQVYPNPATDNITLMNIRQNPGIIYIDIISATGQLVQTSSVNSVNATISLEGLSAGNYFLKIYNNELNEVRKVVIQ